MTSLRRRCYAKEVSESDKQRRFLRSPVGVEFRVRDADDVIGGEIMFDALDISAGGAFLRSEFLLEIGDRTEVTFTLPKSGAPIVVRARVVWVTPHRDLKGDAGMGNEFIDLTDEERGAIALFVRDKRAARLLQET